MSDCKTIAICNQKGGVTKTTTTANLGVGLSMQGKNVLLVDIDPQADLTMALGWPNSDALRFMRTTPKKQLGSWQGRGSVSLHSISARRGWWILTVKLPSIWQ